MRAFSSGERPGISSAVAGSGSGAAVRLGCAGGVWADRLRWCRRWCRRQEPGGGGGGLGHGCQLDLWLRCGGLQVGEQRGGQERDGADAAVRRAGVHGDGESVAPGEHPDDGEAELGRVVEAGDVHLAASTEQLGGAFHGVAVHADARVVDDDTRAVVHVSDVHLDRGVGLGVAGGVVEQLGDRQDDRLHGAALHRDVDLAVDAYAPVVADARGGAPDDLDERGGGALPARPGAAQDGDGLGTAAELGVGVVDFEKVAQHVGVVVPVLHLGDGHLLLVGEGLDRAHGRLESGLGGLVGADLGVLDGAGEAGEHLVEALAELRLGEPAVERSDAGHALAGVVGEGRQADRDQMAQFLLPGPHVVGEDGVPSALPPGDPVLAQQEYGGGEQGRCQGPGHRLRYRFGHEVQVLTSSSPQASAGPGRRAGVDGAPDASGATARVLSVTRREVVTGRTSDARGADEHATFPGIFGHTGPGGMATACHARVPSGSDRSVTIFDQAEVEDFRTADRK